MPKLLMDFLSCPHRFALEKASAAGEIEKPHADAASERLLDELAIAHEDRWFAASVERSQGEIVVIDSTTSVEERASLTEGAMRRGAWLIRGATLATGTSHVTADFVWRVAQSSDLGGHAYEAIAARALRHSLPASLLQLCGVSDRLRIVQGTPPERVHVALREAPGVRSFRLADFSALFRRVHRDFSTRARQLTTADTVPEPSDSCASCPWLPACETRWRTDDHLVMIAGLSRAHRMALREAGARTMSDLKVMPVDHHGGPFLPATFERARRQARVQRRGRAEGELIWELTPSLEPERGFLALPSPSPHDVFVRVESDPEAADSAPAHLFGAAWRETVTSRYLPIWALTCSEAEEGFEKLVAFIEQRRTDHPEMHVYYYGPATVRAFERLADADAVVGRTVCSWLRAGILVDLQAVIRESITASIDNDSLEGTEALSHFRRSVSHRVARADSVALARWLLLGGPSRDLSLLERIASRNRDDCLSMIALRDWLEGQREVLEKLMGPLTRPAAKKQPGASGDHDALETGALIDALIAGRASQAGRRTASDHVQWTLARGIDQDDRHERAVAWSLHRSRRMGVDAAIEAPDCLAGLEFLEVITADEETSVARYRFPPQDHRIQLNEPVLDGRTGGSAGIVVCLDDVVGVVELRRPRLEALHPTIVVSSPRRRSHELTERMIELARHALLNDMNVADEWSAARDLLLRSPLLLDSGIQITREPGESTTEHAIRMVRALSSGVMIIQGPPGTGRTFTAVHLLLDLVRNGKRVGVLGHRSATLAAFVAAICGHAKAPVRVAHRGIEDCAVAPHPFVVDLDAADIASVAGELRQREVDVLATTAATWAARELRRCVDVLLVLEADSVTLRDALAAAHSTRHLVLIGDHSRDEAETSAFGYLLGDAATVPSDRGVFLGQSFRMHKTICRFVSEAFYDHRLEANAVTRQQRIVLPGRFAGAGLRFVPTIHVGRRTQSPEEVLAIGAIFAELTTSDARWIDDHGETRRLTAKDILIVTPYAAQAAAIRQHLPTDARERVAVVDAVDDGDPAVVIYSLATSTSDDAPHGLEHVLSGHRLRSALTRARCLGVIVANPALFSPPCTSSDRMRLASVFALLLEHAKDGEPVRSR